MRTKIALLGLSTALLGADISRAPYLQDVREDRAAILWTTTGTDGVGSVRCASPAGTIVSANSSVTAFPPEVTAMAAVFYQHQAALSQLTPGTDYACRVVLDGVATGPELRLRTASSGPFRFLVFGDSGDGAPAQAGLAQEMLAENANLVLHTGDLAYQNGTFQQYEDYYFRVYASLMRRVPFFPVPGNHDYETGQAAAFRAGHSLPAGGVPPAGRGLYYSFDWSNVHFVALDTNISLINALAGTGRMLDWLESDLSRNRLPWTIVFFHHTAFPTNHHLGDPTCGLVRLHVVPILERHGVQLVLAGHEHNYQRTKTHNGDFRDDAVGAVYLTTGGGGATLHPILPNPLLVVAASESHYLRIDVSGLQMKVQAVRPDGSLIDSFSLTASPLAASGAVHDAAAFGTTVAPGGLISIFGWNLASGEELAPALPYPTRLGGVQVDYGNPHLPLLYVSRTQINAQLSFGPAFAQTLRVITPAGEVSVPLQWRETAPAVFLVTAQSAQLPAITHLNGSLVSFQSPAKPGEWLSLYLTGLGDVDGPINAGDPASSSPLLNAKAKVRVVIDQAEAAVSFAGLAPGFAGLYQVNFQVPAAAAPSPALRVVAGSAASTPVTLLVLAGPAQ